MRRFVVFLLLAVIVPLYAHAATAHAPGTVDRVLWADAASPVRSIAGDVIKVVDGDTVHLSAQGTKIKVRLYGIDAPETAKIDRKAGRVRKPGQPYGDAAANLLEKKVLKRQVNLEVMDTDRYKRVVGIIWIDGRNINKEMVAEGYAWAFRRYLKRPYARAAAGRP